VSEGIWKFTLGLLVLGAAGSAAAQDYTAGKTAAQLFQSDCSACHKSPQGLAKGMDQRALVSFLREHYTTKQESAGALAAYVAGAGPGDARQRPPSAAAVGQNPKPAEPRQGVGTAEGERGQKPATRSRATAATAPEPRHGAGEGIKPAARPRVVTVPAGPAAEPAPQPDDATVSKLKSYGTAGGSAQETERLADPAKKLESYSTSGSPAPAMTPEPPIDAVPAEPGPGAATVPAADAANPTPKRKGSARRKDNAGGAAAGTTSGTSAPHALRPRRAQGPVLQPPPGNN
jgi:hypothetical protein